MSSHIYNSFRPGQAIATSTYSGDLIFWKLETGQSYKRYNVSYPTGLFKLEFMRIKEDKKGDAESVTSKGSRGSSRGKKEKAKQTGTPSSLSPQKYSAHKNVKPQSRSLPAEKSQSHIQRNLSVHCLLFLKSREMLPDQATVLTATENGMIQVLYRNNAYIFSYHIYVKYIGLETTTATQII